MPTKRHGKVRHLLKEGRAKVVRRTPFTIRLLYETQNRTQPVILGVDAGSRHVGVSACTKKEELFSAEMELRDDVVKLLKARRELRRSRRNRKTRYRAPRFMNRVRNKHKGWLAPSVEVKIREHITMIKRVCGILPVTKCVIETAEFDLQALKADANDLPKPEGIEYQHGEMYGFYNARQYVLWRDGYKCRHCGSVGGILYVVNSEGVETGSPEDKHTICKKCFLAGQFKPKKNRHWTHPTFMGIMRKTLMERLNRELSGVEVLETTGADTKETREKHGIEKSHRNDARCITGNALADPVGDWYCVRPVRHHNRQLHRCTFLKGHIRKNNQAPDRVFGFRLWDKVLYQGKEYYISGRRVSGSFSIIPCEGGKKADGVSCKKLRRIEPAVNYLTERRSA